MKQTAKAAALLAVLMLTGGCFSFDGADKGAAPAAAPAAAQAAEPAVEKSVVQADLDKAAKALVSRASRTVMPSKAKPNVKKKGSQNVYSYIEIDPTQYNAVLHRGSTAATPYTGLVEYSEYEMECTGATKAEAFQHCVRVHTRFMKELIRHDGKKWQY